MKNVLNIQVYTGLYYQRQGVLYLFSQLNKYNTKQSIC